jgi:diguanylate cyclase (GGDEF)-like protein
VHDPTPRRWPDGRDLELPRSAGRPTDGHAPAYRAYAAAWGCVGLGLAVAGLPRLSEVDLGPVGLLLALGAAGNLITVRLPGGVVYTMQGPVALAAVWLVGWPVGIPLNLLSALVLAVTQRASLWRAVLYLGNATAGLALADLSFHAVVPGALPPNPTWREAFALLAAGAAFGALTGVVVSAGRFLDTRDPAHLRPKRWLTLTAAAVVLYVPLSHLMVVALRAGPGGAVLATSVWLLASLAVKGLADTHEANRRLEAALASLREVAATDPLTGLYNRRRFDEALAWECQRAGRTGHPFSLLLADLRGLKRTNDSLGHHAGDLLLQSVAQALRRSVRATDLVFRIGGDEFALILPETGVEGAALVAQAAVDEVQRVRVRVEGRVLQPRLTVGASTYPDDGTSPQQLTLAADLAMYRARELGRPVGQLKGPLALPPSG